MLVSLRICAAGDFFLAPFGPQCEHLMNLLDPKMKGKGGKLLHFCRPGFFKMKGGGKAISFLQRTKFREILGNFGFELKGVLDNFT